MSYVDNPAVTVTQTVVGLASITESRPSHHYGFNSSSVMTIYKGYDGSVVDSKSYQ